MADQSYKQPVVYIPHGGGPFPFADIGVAKRDVDVLVDYFKSIPSVPTQPPTAVLVISAHWECDQPTVMTKEEPGLLFDYYGFPPETYELTWSARSDAAVAERVQELLKDAGYRPKTNSARGYDHGTFVPLKIAYPDGEVPIVQLSLRSSLDAADHINIGKALAPLRDEGVYIIGSGSSYHNLSNMLGRGDSDNTFSEWLQEVSVLPESERNDALAKWVDAPGARDAHPREEHLIPLMVVAGAAGSDVGVVPYAEPFAGSELIAVHFGV